MKCLSVGKTICCEISGGHLAAPRKFDGVLLGREHHCSRMLCDKPRQRLQILHPIDMMVFESQLPDHAIARSRRRARTVPDYRFPTSGSPPYPDRSPRPSLPEDGLRAERLHAGEIDVLVGGFDQHLAHDAPVERIHLLGTFGHDEIVGAVQLPGTSRSEPSGSIHLHGTCGVDQHDVDLRLYITVLETVVHDDQIHLGMLGADAADTVRSPFAHHDAHIGKFAFDLQRFESPTSR